MKIVSKYIISYYDLLEQKVDHLADSTPEFLFFSNLFCKIIHFIIFSLIIYITNLFIIFF